MALSITAVEPSEIFELSVEWIKVTGTDFTSSCFFKIGETSPTGISIESSTSVLLETKPMRAGLYSINIWKGDEYVALPAALSVIIYTQSNLYNTLSKFIRDADVKDGEGFLRNMLSGYQYQIDRLKTKTSELLQNIEIDALDRDDLEQKARLVALGKREIRAEIEYLSDAVYKKLVISAVRMWRGRFKESGMIDAIRLITGEESVIYNWFYNRVLLGDESVVGIEANPMSFTPLTYLPTGYLTMASCPTNSTILLNASAGDVTGSLGENVSISSSTNTNNGIYTVFSASYSGTQTTISIIETTLNVGGDTGSLNPRYVPAQLQSDIIIMEPYASDDLIALMHFVVSIMRPMSERYYIYYDEVFQDWKRDLGNWTVNDTGEYLIHSDTPRLSLTGSENYIYYTDDYVSQWLDTECEVIFRFNAVTTDQVYIILSTDFSVNDGYFLQIGPSAGVLNAWEFEVWKITGGANVSFGVTVDHEFYNDAQYTIRWQFSYVGASRKITIWLDTTCIMTVTDAAPHIMSDNAFIGIQKGTTGLLDIYQVEAYRIPRTFDLVDINEKKW